MSESTETPPRKPAQEKAKTETGPQPAGEQRPPEVGGQKGPEPTRYGDWEKGGIVSDF